MVSKEHMRSYVAARVLSLKLRAIAYKGGKCQICGYEKCPAALEFHHRDPNEKDYDWNKMRRRAWDDIIKELDKCDMLCANCHRERHYDPSIAQRAIEFLKSKSRYVSQIACDNCQLMFKPKLHDIKFCSHKCVSENQQKIKWPDNLPALVAVAKSVRALAKELGVSDKAIVKRLRNHH